jgi:hypothetical protein
MFKLKDFDGIFNKKHYLIKFTKICISIGLAVILLSIISIVINKNSNAIKNNNIEYLNKSIKICETLKYKTSFIEIKISMFFSVSLFAIYIFICKRRSFLIKKFKCQNFSLPLITAIWNKNNRVYPSLVYVLITIQIMQLFETIFSKEISDNLLLNFCSTFQFLFLTILRIFLIGLSKTN